LSHTDYSKIIKDNLNAIHSARKAFIESENNEKIRRALLHNVRTSSEIKYVTGDIVYYKRDNTKQWRGPGVVIGQVGQQVFVKHGSFYIRVHPCRIQLQKPIRNILKETNLQNGNNNIEATSLENRANETSNEIEGQQSSDSDSENELVDNTDQTTNASNEAEDQSQPNTTRNEVPQNCIPKNKNVIKSNGDIRFKTKEGDPWIEATILCRAGKHQERTKIGGTFVI